MVGYILGLGDRHFQNILIDNNTAELIHIDFGNYIFLMKNKVWTILLIRQCCMNYYCNIGVAFDQGTLLTTPETVPFRLTRDIVDGMGICGIEGTFRKYETKITFNYSNSAIPNLCSTEPLGLRNYFSRALFVGTIKNVII